MPTRIDIHPAAAREIRALDRAMQARIRKTLYALEPLDDPRQRLLPYVENLKGFWKLRVGDYRLVCELKRDDQGHVVLVVHVVHRREAYLAHSVRTIKSRTED